MRLWIAYIDDLYEVFNRAVHCDPAHSGFSMRSTHEAGGVMEIEVERKQTGWAIMHPAEKRNAMLIESPTGLVEDAYVWARGRITGVPGDWFESTQIIKITCAPKDLAQVANVIEGTVDGPLLTYAKNNLDVAPYTCWWLADVDRNDPSAYIIARTVDYFFDPATHEISTSELFDGPLINLSRAHIHEEEEGGIKPTMELGELPVERVRIPAVAGWTQSASGTCNVADRIKWAGNSSIITTCNPDFSSTAPRDIPDGLLNFSLGSGWTMGDSMMLCTQSVTSEFLTWRRSLLEFEIDVTYLDNNGFAQKQTETYNRLHGEMASLEMWSFNLLSLQMHYEYEQEREETAIVVVDMPIQSIPGIETVEEMSEVMTVDLLADPDAEPYDTGDYEVGDRIEKGGLIFVCNEAHTSYDFSQLKPGMTTFDPQTGFYNGHPYWDEVPTGAAIKATANEFWTTATGRMGLAHLALRGRRRLVDRARAVLITLVYPWYLARDLTLKHMLRVEVPWHDGTSRAMKGKVVKIERAWDGDEGASITVTIAVSLGTGTTGTTDKGMQPLYGRSDNIFSRRYLRDLDDGDDTTEVFGAGTDTEFVVVADPVSRPVDADMLPMAAYSVIGVRRENEAPVQLGYAIERANSGRDPTYAMVEHPTRVGVRMMNLSSEGIIKRDVYVAAEVLASPRGIDLIDGEEP